MRLLCCGCLVFLLGCGGKGPELPVSGTVTLDGNPVPNVIVRFYPEGDTNPESNGFAQTGSDGKYVIVGAKDKKGLVAGKYKVTVSKGTAKSTSEENVGAVIPEIEFKDDFAPIYSDPNRTILSYSVTGDGQPIDIKLDSKRKK